jgi:predicted permease
MIFRETGTHPLTFEAVQPLLVGFLTQLTMHLILIPIVRCFVPDDRIPHFLKFTTSVLYSEFAYFSNNNLESPTRNYADAAVGIHIFSHGLRPTECRELIVCLVFKLIGLPAIAAVWCYVLGLEKSVAAVVLLHAMPMGLLGYEMALMRQWDLGTPTLTFVWSNLLGLPVPMRWVLAINELGLFGGK